MKNLIQKYNIPGPRYTSYPTVPYWNKDGIAIDDWKHSTLKAFEESNESEGISLYIHLPFCESLCTFCACHKRITKRHSVEEPYMDTVLKEWNLYCDLLVKRSSKNINCSILLVNPDAFIAFSLRNRNENSAAVVCGLSQTSLKLQSTSSYWHR